MQNRFVQCLASAAFAALAITGCTSREWYESANANAKADCNRLQPGAREDCLSRVNRTPYDTYEKERTRQNP